ncbi:MAG: HAD hydrolase-like protein, partial [Nevskiaceae bacterium]|nr:HAD hydrolase-like protein [Nevskiaceae bacterium]
MSAARKKKTLVRRKPVQRKSTRQAIKGFMFDLDGTLVLGDRTGKSYDVLPGAIEVLQRLDERGIPWVVLTNGSAYPASVQAPRLRAVGLPVPDERLLTPSSVTAGVLSRRGVKRALILGSPGVGHALKEAGIDITFTGEPECERVDAVYIGWHPECGMKDIEAACNAIWGGAKLYVASDVPFFASKTGRMIGYSYAITAAVRRMTKAPAMITGKPSLHALRHVARHLGVAMNEVGVVGDDPLVEMIMARRGGATGFGVCTGTTNRAQWLKQPLSRRPTHII